MNDEYILILGAGLMQKPALDAVKSLGFKSLVVDANPNALCVPMADKFVCIDLKDKEKILDLALSYKNKLKAVFTCGTDFSANVSYVAQKCSLPSHSYEATLNASNKILMRECFKKSNVSSPEFIKISEDDLKDFSQDKINSFLFPKVVKPVDNMGARGCRIIRDASEFIYSVEQAIKYSREKTAILEDYMEGPEFSIDALVCNGKVIITGFADRHIYFSPYFVELGHTMPSSVDDKIKDEVIQVFIQGIHSLGLTCGAAKGDVKYTETGPMIGEIAARLSGGYMSGWTFPYASDFPLTRIALEIALGRNTVYLDSKSEVLCTSASAERAFISIPGKIKKIYGEDAAKSIDGIKNYFPRVKDGDEVVFPRNNVEKCGNFISLAETLEDAANIAENAVSKIILRLETNNEETENFLSQKENQFEKNFPYSAFELSKDENDSFVKEINSLNKTLNFPCNEILFLKSLENISDRKDFNHRSMKNTLTEFFNLAANSKKEFSLDAKKFWLAFIRGGIQGILYLADCALEGILE